MQLAWDTDTPGHLGCPRLGGTEVAQYPGVRNGWSASLATVATSSTPIALKGATAASNAKHGILPLLVGAGGQEEKAVRQAGWG